MKLKQQLPLILAFAAPVILIGITALTVYIPKLHNKPKYDFIYTIGSYYPAYAVDASGHIFEETAPIQDGEVPNPVTKGGYTAPIPQLYYYDVATQKGTPITLDQAKKHQLSALEQSPDGYSIGYGGNDGVFPFFVSDSNNYNIRYIQGHGINQKINIATPIDSYNYNFQMIGWVIN